MTRKARRYPVGTMICVDSLIFEVVRYSDDCVILSRGGRRFATAANWLAHMVTDAILPQQQAATEARS